MLGGALLKCGAGFRTVDVPYLGLPGIDQDAHGCCTERPPGERQPPVMSLADHPQGPGELPGVLGEVAAGPGGRARGGFGCGFPASWTARPSSIWPTTTWCCNWPCPAPVRSYPRALLTYNSKTPCHASPYGAKWRWLFEQPRRAAGRGRCGGHQGGRVLLAVHRPGGQSGCTWPPTAPVIRSSGPPTAGSRPSPTAWSCTTRNWKTTSQQPRGVGTPGHAPAPRPGLDADLRPTALLESITDPFDRLTTFTYTDGRLTKITDHAGRETLFQIDGGCLRSVTLPESTVTSLVYDTRGRVLAHVAPGGSRTSYSYDRCGRVETVTTPQGEVTTFTVVDGQLRASPTPAAM